jgi:hypothetical protein
VADVQGVPGTGRGRPRRVDRSFRERRLAPPTSHHSSGPPRVGGPLRPRQRRPMARINRATHATPNGQAGRRTADHYAQALAARMRHPACAARRASKEVLHTILYEPSFDPDDVAAFARFLTAIVRPAPRSCSTRHAVQANP